jgi:hypothetical protein
MRERIADTNEQRPLLSDERLNYYLENDRNEWFAAEEACKFIANDAAACGKYELSEEFKQRAKELHNEGLLHVGPVIVSADDESRFKSGMHDYK